MASFYKEKSTCKSMFQGNDSALINVNGYVSNYIILLRIEYFLQAKNERTWRMTVDFAMWSSPQRTEVSWPQITYEWAARMWSDQKTPTRSTYSPLHWVKPFLHKRLITRNPLRCVESIKLPSSDCEGGGLEWVVPTPRGGIVYHWPCTELLAHGDNRQKADV